MDGSLTADGNIFKCMAELCRRAEVFDGQKVVRRIEHRRGISEQSARRSGPRRSKRCSAGKHCFQRFVVFRRVEYCRRLFDRGEIAALAAERKRADNPRRAEQPDAAAGEPFGGGQAPGKRQLNYERYAAAHRGFRAGKFIVGGRLTALHKIAGHYRDDGRIRAAAFTYFSYLVLVSAVKRIVFRNDTDRFHRNPSFFLLRFGEKNAKISICDTMIP